MQRVLIRLFLVVMLLRGTVAAAQAATRPAEKQDPPIAWGEPSKGVRLGVRAERNYYGPQDDPFIEIFMQRIGDQPVLVALPDNAKNAEFRDHIEIVLD